MGLFSSKLCSPYDDVAARVLILGLDSAGKSTLLYRLSNLTELQFSSGANFIYHIPSQPTVVYQVETIYPRLSPIPLNLWDLGGQEKVRALWKYYVTGIEGLIFVIDSTDHSRIHEVQQELLRVMDLIDDKTTPIVIAANKQDLEHALDVQELKLALCLPELKVNVEWPICPTSAFTGEGVMDAFCLLAQLIHRRRWQQQ
ncbi:unnamed protein product [Didymodactylos carnosus]|uniref:Uncharacterized protein n=1 Tax=Didymodactylos carnosus TaxID=1234261 RepID=A0A8S2VDA8_9BILA|nr:unnamed protein product [Didymodactylos carnosus]CAF4393527.1 unnamed protein product [Didymodactylos carnosus]